jgi:hypothetical protein
MHERAGREGVRVKLRLPWQKAASPATGERPTPPPCAHRRVEVEMHGTAIKRRWCAVCGQELPVAERSGEGAA